jgi:type IV secretory pathway VirB2 component (pilin)
LITKLIGVCMVIATPFAIAAAWPTPTSVKTAPTDQQLDQVVMAIQGLVAHREAVIRGREILRGVLYRWGNGQ